MDLLILLINKYEDEQYKIDLPDPIESVKFRMEQQGLKNTDLIPFIGNKSKVSEVLNKKRPLSLNMIRKLHYGLGIPAEVLIADPDKTLPEEINGIDWQLFPITEMIKKRWIDFEGSIQQAKEHAEEIIREFFGHTEINLSNNQVFFRKSIRANSDIDEYALSVWHAKTLIEQEKFIISKKYNKENLDDIFIDELKRLSMFNDGPSLAIEYLSKFGVRLIIVPHFKGTHLDGATFLNSNNEPIICLTLRYDRIDYFWFTLFHELAHLTLHLNDEIQFFFDDLRSTENITQCEQEADIFAEERLLSKEDWDSFYNQYLTEQDIIDFADKCRISPAIVAGRVQKIRKDFSIFRQLLGQNDVKKVLNITSC